LKGFVIDARYGSNILKKEFVVIVNLF
jgi:hypothetical protein